MSAKGFQMTPAVKGLSYCYLKIYAAARSSKVSPGP